MAKRCFIRLGLLLIIFISSKANAQFFPVLHENSTQSINCVDVTVLRTGTANISPPIIVASAATISHQILMGIMAERLSFSFHRQ